MRPRHPPGRPRAPQRHRGDGRAARLWPRHGGSGGVLTAIYLNEVGGRFTQVVRGRHLHEWVTGHPGRSLRLLLLDSRNLPFGFSGFAGRPSLVVILLPR